MGNGRIQPVGSHDILRQIIGADGEKRRLLGQFWRNEHRCRGFNHHTQRKMGAGLPLRSKLGHTIINEGAGAPHFADIRHHRQHHLDIADNGGAQQCPQLDFENIRPVKAHAHPAPAQKRIFLIRKLNARHGLVAAHIQRADNHRIGRKSPRQR